MLSLLLVLLQAPTAAPAPHVSEWTLRSDPATGAAFWLAGPGRRPGLVPATEREWEERARTMVEHWRTHLGVDPDTLTLRSVRRLDLSRFGGTDKVVVVFGQASSGVPVLGATVAVAFAADGSFRFVTSSAAPGLGPAAAVPSRAPSWAPSRARSAFLERRGVEPDHSTSPQPVWVRGRGEERGRVVLAWQVEAWRDGRDGARVLIGDDGALLGFDALVHACGGERTATATGSVSVWATPAAAPNDLGPDGPLHPPVLQAAPSLAVLTPFGATVTNANGNFGLTNAPPFPFPASFQFLGPFAAVHDAGGASYVEDALLVPGAANAVVLNPTLTEEVTAQANAFLQIGRFRDWVRSVDPEDATMDVQVLAYVNEDAPRIAWFEQGPQRWSIHFSRATATRPNAAYSTLVAHELGHWANELYGVGNDEASGFGEGLADAWAMYVYDTPYVGMDFFGPGTWLREGGDGNQVQFCGDDAPGCHGDPYVDGQVLSGALWKTREALAASLGDPAGDDLANALFLGWLQTFGDRWTSSLIRDHWLLLDDDDGNLLDGTPHQDAIEAGFLAHGFPAFSTNRLPAPTTVFAGNPDGSQFGGGGPLPDLSADGRWLALESDYSLVADDRNHGADVYRLDRQTGDLVLVSVDVNGNSVAAGGYMPSMSADGRVIGFVSYARDLVPNDHNGVEDVFVRDLETGTTRLVSVSLSGNSGNAATKRLLVSGNGRHAAFTSAASDLVPNDTNGAEDLFVRDLVAGTTTRCNLDVQGNESTGQIELLDLSWDGRFVLFSSDADDLVAGDTNGLTDLFVRDVVLGTTRRVSVGSGGVELTAGANRYSGGISDDGRFVLFQSHDPSLPGHSGSDQPYVHDLDSGITEWLGQTLSGTPTQHNINVSYISADGRFASFSSDAGDLAPHDTNGRLDVFLRDRWRGTTEIVNLYWDGRQTYTRPYGGRIAGNGRFAIFFSLDMGLDPSFPFLWNTFWIRDRGTVFPYLVHGPMVRDALGWWEVGGLEPGMTAYVLAGPSAGRSPAPAALGGGTVDLGAPIVVLGSAVADTNGVARIVARVPGFSGADVVHLQAFVPAPGPTLPPLTSEARAVPLLP